MNHTTDRRPATVNDGLTINDPEDGAPATSPKRPGRRRRSEVENDDFARFVVRIIRAHGRQICEGDVEGLGDLLNLGRELDAATQVAVDHRLFGSQRHDRCRTSL